MHMAYRPVRFLRLAWLALLFSNVIILWAEPHRVVLGSLVRKGAHSLVVQASTGAITLALTPNTMIWKGSGHESASVLKEGDEIAAKYSVSPDHEFVATEIWANIINLYGKIIAVQQPSFILSSYPNADPHSGYVKSDFTVRYEPATKFVLSAPADLIDGRAAQVVGVKLDDRTIEANQITIYEGNRPVRMDPTKAVIIPRQ